MERVSDEWISRTLAMAEQNSGTHGTVEILGRVLVKVLNELQARREAEKEQRYTDHSASGTGDAEATQEREKAILPLPVKKVDGVSVSGCTVKDWFQKINEELDELKESILTRDRLSVQSPWFGGGGSQRFYIADEAADTITAITSMLEAMGITEHERQAAQERVNQRNRERGRL